MSVPTTEQVQEWQDDGGCKATDGCWVESDGRCEPDQPSWLLALGPHLTGRWGRDPEVLAKDGRALHRQPPTSLPVKERP